MVEKECQRPSADGSIEWAQVTGHDRWLPRVGIAVAGILLAYRLTQWVRDGWSLDVALGLLMVLSLGVVFTALLRPRTRADKDGLLLRGALSAERRILWPHIQAIRAGGGRRVSVVEVVLRDGRSHKLPGVAVERIDDVRAARRLNQQ